MRIVFVVLRVIAAVGIAVAAFAQLGQTLAYWPQQGVDAPGYFVLNFFSFFTIDSNLGSAVTLLIGAVLLLVGRGEDPRWFALLRMSVTTYMTVTGVVYNLLLRNVELPQGLTVPWSNEVLHVIAPAYLVIDWLFAPGRRRLEWKAVWVAVIFPIVWAAYTLIRGPLVVDPTTGNPYWYPYPFLNPNLSANGYLSVAFYVILIAAIIIGVAAAAIWVSRRGRWPLRST